MKDTKSVVISTIQKIIINKLCHKEIISSANVNTEVLAIQQQFKKMPAPFKVTKRDAKKIFKHIKSRLVLIGSGI